MSVGSASRQLLAAEGPGPRRIPEDLLRFAALPEEQRKLLIQVGELLGEIAFGNIVIVLQDGKVMQIETSEKIRLR